MHGCIGNCKQGLRLYRSKRSKNICRLLPHPARVIENTSLCSTTVKILIILELDVEKYNYDTLLSIQNETVTISDDAGNTTNITVKEVTKSRLDGPDWEAFSVAYTNNSEIRIPEGTYQFTHPSFGSVDLFLSPKSWTESETVVIRKREEHDSPSTA